MKRVIRLTESDIHNMVKQALNEISDEMIARAYAATNVEYDDLHSSDGQLALNRNGQKVHRDTQKKRRDRQNLAFKNALSKSLTKKFGKNVNIAKNGTGENTRYYGDYGYNRGYDYKGGFHHYSPVDASEPTSVYHMKNGGNFGHSDMKAADYITNLVDGMAGYHDELTDGKYYQKRINNLNDRADDVEAIQKYYRDKKDYEERKRASEMAVDSFNRKPWYKKIGKTMPVKFSGEKPKFPDIKTGPYFMPDNTDGIYDEIEKTNQNRERNKNAYNKYLKKK